MYRFLTGVLLTATLAACAPEMATSTPEPDVPPVSGIGSDLEPQFVPSLVARPGRPCGDIVGLAHSGEFTAGMVQLGETTTLTDATPEMIDCVKANGLEETFTLPSF